MGKDTLKNELPSDMKMYDIRIMVSDLVDIEGFYILDNDKILMSREYYRRNFDEK